MKYEKNPPVKTLSVIAVTIALLLYGALNYSEFLAVLGESATLEMMIKFLIKGTFFGIGAGFTLAVIISFVYIVFATDSVRFMRNKDDIIRLIESKYVPYEKTDEFTEKGLGRYIGGFDDKWVWNTDKLRELPEKELLSICRVLK